MWGDHAQQNLKKNYATNDFAGDNVHCGASVKLNRTKLTLWNSQNWELICAKSFNVKYKYVIQKNALSKLNVPSQKYLEHHLEHPSWQGVPRCCLGLVSCGASPAASTCIPFISSAFCASPIFSSGKRNSLKTGDCFPTRLRTHVCDRAKVNSDLAAQQKRI